MGLAIIALVLALPVALILAISILICHIDPQGIFMHSKEVKRRRVIGANNIREK